MTGGCHSSDCESHRRKYASSHERVIFRMFVSFRWRSGRSEDRMAVGTARILKEASSVRRRQLKASYRGDIVDPMTRSRPDHR